MNRAVELDIGLVVAGHGRHYTVETPEGARLTCSPRGKKSDCVVGDRTTFSNNAQIAGHVHIGDWAVLGALLLVAGGSQELRLCGVKVIRLADVVAA